MFYGTTGMGRTGTLLVHAGTEILRANPFVSPISLSLSPWLRAAVCSMNDSRFGALTDSTPQEVALERPFRCSDPVTRALALDMTLHFVRGETKALLSTLGGWARLSVEGPEEVKVLPFSALPTGSVPYSMSANARWVVFKTYDVAARTHKFTLFDADAWPEY